MNLRISGALFATSLISWGYLLWNHMPQSSVWIPAVIGLVVAVCIEVFERFK
jgi:hypothetical protein